jgi:hypothetical protein
MFLPPAVIIHGLEDARLALSHRRPVTLLSAPAAALYAGCLWWFALLAAAETPYPALLDCADAPGRAVEALAQIAELAGMQGAVLRRAAPPALDLAIRGADRKLAAWLEAENA